MDPVASLPTITPLYPGGHGSAVRIVVALAAPLRLTTSPPVRVVTATNRWMVLRIRSPFESPTLDGRGGLRLQKVYGRTRAVLRGSFVGLPGRWALLDSNRFPVRRGVESALDLPCASSTGRGRLAVGPSAARGRYGYC